MIQLYYQGGHTMGDTLIAMSLYNSLKEPVNIISRPNNWYKRWKEIFDIGDQITLDEVWECEHWVNPPHPRFMEGFKVFSPYLEVDHIKMYGQNFKVGKRGKKCVAILVNNGDHIKDQEFFNRIEKSVISKDGTDYPFNKYYDKKTFDFLIDLVHAAGYDIMMVDSKDVSLEQKTFLLNEFCDFVIGYEGGMCHLAHILKIPAIIFPWLNGAMDPLWYDHSPVENIHLDKKTYFLKDREEIFEWTPQYLIDMVERLYNDGGNNRWFNDPIFPSIEPYLAEVSGGDNFYAQVEWAKQNINNPTLGGF
jgi:hypothetical protein